MTTTQTMAGKYFLISGIANGLEVFIGKAIDEPFSDNLAVEGKTITYTPQGFMNVKPFATIINFPFRDPKFQIQQISNPEARNEAHKILTTAVPQVHRATYPFTFRWVEASVTALPLNHGIPFTAPHTGVAPLAFDPVQNFTRFAWGATNPFFSFYEGFTTSAEHFRRILFQYPQVTTTREMDKVTELEGNLTIEIGKITNQIAIKFNQLAGRETELTNYFEAIQGFNLPIPTNNHVGGWVYLITRMQLAKSWAQRNGKTPLVREINVFIKEGITQLSEIILEHCTTLDTLITETCTQYGILLEMYGEISPFSRYTTPFSAAVDSLDINNPAMAGAVM